MGIRVLLLVLLAVPAAAAERGWEKEWNETVAAAKREGRVVVAGSPDPVMRSDVIPKFTARFGIVVEFLAGRSSQMAARVRTERQAGIHSIDVFMSGVDTTVGILHKEKMIDPLKPLLLLPEVVDPAKWKRGKPWFLDPEEQYVLRVFNSVTDLLHINTAYVKPEEIRSSKDLVNPKWKGKIAIEDPTVPGSGSNQASRFYLQLGEEFVKKLYMDQNPVRTRERRQLADWLARGTYPICLNCREDDVRALRKEGFTILEIFELSDVKGTTSAAPWLLTVANKAPHPHATKVFVNWMASKEGLETFSRGYGAVTLRTDADESFLRSETIPRPGVAYFDDSEWAWAATGRKETRERVWELLKPR